MSHHRMRRRECKQVGVGRSIAEFLSEHAAGCATTNYDVETRYALRSCPG